MTSLSEMACTVLGTSDGREKAAISRHFATEWFENRDVQKPINFGTAKPPLQPARPIKPELLAPKDVPKRKMGSQKGRKCGEISGDLPKPGRLYVSGVRCLSASAA